MDKQTDERIAAMRRTAKLSIDYYAAESVYDDVIADFRSLQTEEETDE